MLIGWLRLQSASPLSQFLTKSNRDDLTGELIDESHHSNDSEMLTTSLDGAASFTTVIHHSSVMNWAGMGRNGAEWGGMSGSGRVMALKVNSALTGRETFASRHPIPISISKPGNAFELGGVGSRQVAIRTVAKTPETGRVAPAVVRWSLKMLLPLLLLPPLMLSAVSATTSSLEDSGDVPADPSKPICHCNVFIQSEKSSSLIRLQIGEPSISAKSFKSSTVSNSNRKCWPTARNVDSGRKLNSIFSIWRNQLLIREGQVRPEQQVNLCQPKSEPRSPAAIASSQEKNPIQLRGAHSIPTNLRSARIDPSWKFLTVYLGLNLKERNKKIYWKEEEREREREREREKKKERRLFSPSRGKIIFEKKIYKKERKRSNNFNKWGEDFVLF